MEKIKFENWEMKSVKLQKDGGLIVDHHLLVAVDDDMNMVNNPNQGMDWSPKQELLDMFDQFKPMLATVLGKNEFRIMVQSKDFKASKEQAQAAEKVYQLELSKFEVTKVKITGKEETLAVTFSGTYKDASEIKMNINTNPIYLSMNYFGFEEELENLIDELKKLVFAYIYLGDRYEMTTPMFSAPKKQSEKKKEKEVEEIK